MHSGWVIDRFYFARRGITIDPFTNNTLVAVGDLKYTWQTDEVSVPSYPRSDMMRFNQGQIQM